MALLEALNLRRVYGEGDAATVALADASITVDEGEFVAILGASGSGKSTLLHILGLLDHPTSGTYHLAGPDTLALSEPERAHARNKDIGFVFQSFHLLARATVLENVLLPLQYAGSPRSEHVRQATQALEHVKLSHRLHHTPGQLSGGEKQRVAIARALVNNPAIIFADEPTGNLDSATGKAVMDVIAELHREGNTILVITHESATAAYADRAIELKDGRTVATRAIEKSHQPYQK